MTTNPTELIKLANGRVTKGLSYGPQMATSRAMCLADATRLIDMALANVEHQTFWKPFWATRDAGLTDRRSA